MRYSLSMEKSLKLRGCNFDRKTLERALHEVKRLCPEAKFWSLSVEVPDGEWKHDQVEEFWADYRSSSGNAQLVFGGDRHAFSFLRMEAYTVVTAKAPERQEVERVLSIIMDGSQAVPVIPEAPVIFIGHGHDPSWRDLKDHLADKHKYKVEAYEIGARAGHAVRDILQTMLRGSNFAILVMTGEDAMDNGKIHPRLNVVHEAGLFQGVLGFNRAIVLLEEGATEFSNICGIEQLRFEKGRIKETFGDLLAVINREFAPK